MLPGEESFDAFLKQQATQDMRRRFAFCYVLCEDGRLQIFGCYTLNSTSVDLSALPPEVTARLPRYDVVPAALIGRLAIDQRHRGRKLGSALLIDAVRRITEARAAAAFVIVDALDEAAEAFYRHLGFYSLTSSAQTPRRLYMSLPDVRKYFAPDVSASGRR
ncbi:MAG: GNAT family N-acetyltransferase [Dehalococcoidia bacterium]